MINSCARITIQKINMSQKLYEFLSLQNDEDAKLDFHNSNAPGPSNVIIYVSGNWYDEFKVSEIISLAKKYPDAKILISGGVGRLTLPYVQRMGGEPLYLLERLTQEASACDELSSIKERCILCNSSIVTTHNVKFLMYYLSQCADMEGWNASDNSSKAYSKYKIIVVDEGFLLRRLKATILQQIEVHTKVKKDFPSTMIGSLEFISPADCQTSADMSKKHMHGHAVAAFLQIGEFKRLVNYSTGNGPLLFSKELAGLHDKCAEEIWKIVSQLEDDFMDDLDRLLSIGDKKELKRAILPIFQRSVLCEGFGL